MKMVRFKKECYFVYSFPFRETIRFYYKSCIWLFETFSKVQLANESQKQIDYSEGSFSWNIDETLSKKFIFDNYSSVPFRIENHPLLVPVLNRNYSLHT